MFVDGYQISGEIDCFHLQFRKALSRADDEGSSLFRTLGNVVQEGSVSPNSEHQSLQVDSKVKQFRLLKKSYRHFGISYFVHLHVGTAKNVATVLMRERDVTSRDILTFNPHRS